MAGRTRAHNGATGTNAPPGTPRPPGTASDTAPGTPTAAAPPAGAQPLPARERPGSAPARHPFGPRSVGAVLPGVTRAAFRRRSPAGALLMADWAAVVGPQHAARTVPRRLSGGTLTVACSGPVALELQHLAAALLGRINAHYGQELVQRLRFVQEVLPAPPAPRAPAPLGPAPALPGLPDGPLRDALAALGRRVSGRRSGHGPGHAPVSDSTDGPLPGPGASPGDRPAPGPFGAAPVRGPRRDA